MHKIGKAIRLFSFWSALVCIAMTATWTLLLMHTRTQHRHECQHACPEHNDAPLNPHQHHHCRTCELLMGMAGKYICLEPAPTDLEIQHIFFAVYFPAYFIPTRDPLPLSARAPPVL